MAKEHELVQCSDEELLCRLSSGDNTAGAQLYVRHRAMVQRICFGVLRDHDLAADATHDVFVEFLQRSGRVDQTRGCLVTYLRMMARRRAIDAVRRVESARRRERGYGEFTAPVVTPSTRIVELETVQSLRRAIELLPASQRAVIDLAFWKERTQRQMAADLQLPVGTVKTRMRLALQRLRASPNLVYADS